LGLADTRSRAEALIRTGRVLVDDRPIEKPGTPVAADAEIRVRGGERRYVSRGGEKLAPALAHFAIDPTGCVCADIGASTGGFTDCLLQHGAAHVIAIDVGYGQLSATLRNDSRVTVRERENARELAAGGLPAETRLVTVDVSFISVRLILPGLRCAAPDAEVLVLVKPQFEVGREQVGRGGVVRDDGLRHAALASVREAAAALGYPARGAVDCEVPGPKGNREIFLYLGPPREIRDAEPNPDPN
jgi:23S rRNA (cytidine1920-2'-O)/16S rRNA (cytidine1409-2'-O)-methyltransferase